MGGEWRSGRGSDVGESRGKKQDWKMRGVGCRRCSSGYLWGGYLFI